MASCRWASYVSEPLNKIDEELVALPEDEQVSRGQELMSLLLPRELVNESARGRSADWNVIVKQTFIEVVMPPCPEARRRTVSEPVIPSIEKPEVPWKSSSCGKLQDVSDASTDDSLEGEDQTTRDDSIREDVGGSSEGEVEKETPIPPAMPYQYHVESWWMPMGYDASGQVMCAPSGFDQSGMGFNGAAFMPLQWGAPSMTGIECHSVADTTEWATDEWRTTVMIRNMPNNYTRQMLLELVDSIGFAGTYDFAYLPIDFQSQAGLGYAFLNFVSVADALRCFNDLEGFSDWKVPSEKVCTVTWSSPTQGLEDHIDRYRNSPVMHISLPDAWKPVLFQRGARAPFPPPTRPIKTPKVRPHAASKTASA